MGGTPVVKVEDKAAEKAKADAQEIERLRSTNSIYKELVNEWKLYLASYEGGPDFANRDNLFKHQRENKEDFSDRAKRVHYLNYCAPLVDFFTNFIFSETIQREGGKSIDFYLQFIKDVDRRKSDVTRFMRRVCDDMQIYGMFYILVDTPSSPVGAIVTKQDEKDRGIRPYWVPVPPDEVLDWVYDELGNLVYAKRKQIVQELTAFGISTIEKYTEWKTQEIVVSRVDVTDKNNPSYLGKELFTNSVNEVPLVSVIFKESKKFPNIGNSFLRDFAYNGREVMNLTSLLQEFLYRQCFNILAQETDENVPTVDQNEGNTGTSNVLEYPKGAHAPSYVSPPVEPAAFIQSERQGLISQMYRLAAQDLMGELFNGDKSSGFSQAQSFSKTIPFIANRADTLERAENRLMELTAKFMSASWDGKIKYKDHYEITNITDAITQLTSVFRDLGLPSETFAKQELKRLVHELDGKIPPETLVKIEKEIDEMDFGDWQEMQRQALVGRGSSPAEQQAPKSTGTMEEVAAEAKTTNTAATKKLKK